MCRVDPFLDSHPWMFFGHDASESVRNVFILTCFRQCVARYESKSWSTFLPYFIQNTLLLLHSNFLWSFETIAAWCGHTVSFHSKRCLAVWDSTGAIWNLPLELLSCNNLSLLVLLYSLSLVLLSVFVLSLWMHLQDHISMRRCRSFSCTLHSFLFLQVACYRLSKP